MTASTVDTTAPQIAVNDIGSEEDLLAAIDAMTEAGQACLSTAFCMWCQDALVWYLARGDEAGPRRRLSPWPIPTPT